MICLVLNSVGCVQFCSKHSQAFHCNEHVVLLNDMAAHDNKGHFNMESMLGSRWCKGIRLWEENGAKVGKKFGR